MTNEGVKIRYGDVAPEAKENFAVSASEKAAYVRLSELNEYNLDVTNYGNPLEYGAVLLDSASVVFPEHPEAFPMGYVSEQISGADGAFETPVVVTFTADAPYSSQGFTLTFDTANNIFPNEIEIAWYRDGEKLAEQSFEPDSAFYFCHKRVDFFDQVVMTFYRMNLPYNRLKLRSVDYGYGTFFMGDELKSVKVIRELDPLSLELSVNTVDFTLDSKSNIDYSFQRRQPFSVYFGGELQATVFVSSSSRTGKRQWSVKAEDYVGLLDKMTFMGGMYENQNVHTLLESMLTQAKVPFVLSDALEECTVSGYLAVCSLREAVKQICFAVGAVADTAGSDTLNIRFLSSETAQYIPPERIMLGQKLEETERVSEVRLTLHSYEKTTETVQAYKSEAADENVFVTFSEPLYALQITHGEILESGANFALINAGTGCVLSGKKYKDCTTVLTKRNPAYAATEPENIVSITDATLIGNGNGVDRLNACFDSLTRDAGVGLKIIEGKRRMMYGEACYGAVKYGSWDFDTPVCVGDVLAVATEYSGTVAGRVISERYRLNGGILVKECELA